MDRISRRGFFECMAWVGTGVVWTATGGILSSRVLPAAAAEPAAGSFSFVQISDSHVGFKGEANKDAAATLQEVVTKINALPTPPSFVMHTGDLTHGQKPGAFDTVAELLKGVKAEKILYIPEAHAETMILRAHDVAADASVPILSHETLAEMVGTTRARITHFMNKFRTMGLIDYNGELTVRTELLTDLVLHD